LRRADASSGAGAQLEPPPLDRDDREE